ncbi:uncharacterized protein LOC112088540 [Eutrema salsugineum]|uniref:uncharacterized protein LOC112088540 n=1 Tax=Eutrema salsugineum TaxID=72664 RepID=UPI000CECECAB|nr:uncharacterized protein LOC112088540 [Eutrema salsugineum]
MYFEQLSQNSYLQRQGIVEQPRQPENQRASSPQSLRSFVLMMKELGTTHFKGEPNMFEADAWLRNIEKNFKVTECPEEFKKDTAVHYLVEDAEFWWNDIARQYGNDVQSWEAFQNYFERKYFPAEARDQLKREFMELEQGEKNVWEYEAEFTRLRQLVFYGQNDEEAVVQKFLRGLDPEIASRLVAGTFTRLFELYEKAVKVEAALLA